MIMTINHAQQPLRKVSLGVDDRGAGESPLLVFLTHR